jgi:hypothetical protein
MSELRAHQTPAATAVAAFTVVLLGARAALAVAFEFGFGRYVAHESWEHLLRDYDLTRGRVWALVPAWLTVGPLVVRRLQQRR